MLVKLAIDPDAGVELLEGAPSPGTPFLRLLKERCLLVVEKPAAAASLLRAFQGGPVELAEAMAILVQSHLIVVDVADPTPLTDIERLEEVWSWAGLADLLVLADYRLAVLGRHTPGTAPEYANMREVLNATVLDRAQHMWDDYLHEGMPREEVWRERLEPFARNTKRLCIVDQWLAADMGRRLKHGATNRADHGAEWFLGHLARTGIETIKIASSARRAREVGLAPEETRRQIVDWFQARNQRATLDLHIVDGNFDHGRRVAFDGWVGFEMHNGLASFDRPRIAEGMGLHASPRLCPEVFRHFEMLVGSHAGA